MNNPNVNAFPSVPTEQELFGAGMPADQRMVVENFCDVHRESAIGSEYVVRGEDRYPVYRRLGKTCLHTIVAYGYVGVPNPGEDDMTIAACRLTQSGLFVAQDYEIISVTNQKSDHNGRSEKIIAAKGTVSSSPATLTLPQGSAPVWREQVHIGQITVVVPSPVEAFTIIGYRS